jgi:DNA-binding MurR/RpiR family transcriptional regulator
VAEIRSIADESIISRIRYRPSGFTPVEGRIAAAILEDPVLVSRESIVKLARRISVSTGSIVRFTRLLGLSGFGDLKLALAESAVRGGPAVIEGARTTRFRACMDEQIRAIVLAAQTIDTTTLEAAAYVISHAKRIDLAATGSSAPVAQTLLFSFTLMGLHARLLPDSGEQGAAAAFLGEGDCLIAISVSGRTRTTVDAALRASAAGATVIAICGSQRSPLMRHAGISLLIDSQAGRFQAEWPVRTAMLALSRALILYIAEQLPQKELDHRRSTWSSARFGIRY